MRQELFSFMHMPLFPAGHSIETAGHITDAGDCMCHMHKNKDGTFVPSSFKFYIFLSYFARIKFAVCTYIVFADPCICEHSASCTVRYRVEVVVAVANEGPASYHLT